MVGGLAVIVTILICKENVLRKCFGYGSSRPLLGLYIMFRELGGGSWRVILVDI